MGDRPEKRRKLDTENRSDTPSPAVPLHLERAPTAPSSLALSSTPSSSTTLTLPSKQPPPIWPGQPSSDSGSSLSVHLGRGETISIEGYRDVRVISTHYEDTVACRAISIARGDKRILLKVSLSGRPSAAAQFKAEATLLSQLKEAGVHNVTNVIAREAGRLGPMMIIADDDIRLLHEIYLTDRRPAPYWTDSSDLLQALDLVTKLVRTIARIHTLNIVHGSLRPTTISVSIFSEIHLHDFSCAFRLGPEGESGPIRERGMREEMLPYLAPECTGRVGKSADARSDFYAIGATIYELFTGRTPFPDAVDPLEIIHAHVARRPPLMHTLDSSIPEPLSLIVAKLLEKNPDARYQTSQGLVVDLETVAELIRVRSGAPEATVPGGTLSTDFQIAVVDSAAHFQLPPASRMFGRDDAIQSLASAYDRVKSSHKTAIVVVKGNAGIGKTSLVETVLRKPVVQAKGFWSAVKFDQIKSPVPFFAITGALAGLLRQLLSEPEAELVVWRRRLSQAFGKEGRVLVDVVPLFESVFEPGWVDSLPPLAALSASESEARFQRIVQRILRTFARRGKPLVVAFDDLQWSAPSDIAFILSLSKPSEDTDNHAPASQPMVLICLYRDNEVGPDHVVSTTLLPSLPSDTLTLDLAPLSRTDIMAFVSETLRTPVLPLASGKESELPRDDPRLRELSELILSKTLGSPLFVTQLLKAMNQQRLFTFDFAQNRWQYNLADIAANSLSTDVVHLLQDQMKKFSLATQDILKVAACIGNEEISVSTLAHAAGRSVMEVSYDVREAVDGGLLVPGGETWPDEEPLSLHNSEPRKTLGHRIGAPVPAFYRFFHDRCQQAAYGLVTVSERSATHYRIGQRLVNALSEDSQYEIIFDLANQLNHGIDILSSKDERDRLAHFNYVAAQKATKATAFESARKFLQTAWDLLGSGGWVGQFQLMAHVTEALIEVEYSLTDYAASQEYVRIYLAHSQDEVAKLRVYSRSIRCATATGDSSRAIEIGREGLAMVGIHLPSETAEGAALVDAVAEELALTSDKILALADLPPITDPVASGAQAILAALVPPIYFTRIDLLGALSSLACKVAVQHGLDDAGAFVFTLHAVLVYGRGSEGPSNSIAFGKTAIGFIERHGSSPLSCPTYKVYSSHVAVWHMSIRETIPTFRQAVAYGFEFRDAEYVGFGTGELCSYSLLAGINVSEIAAELDGFSVVVRKFRNELSTLYIGVIQQIVLNLTGRSRNVCELEGEAFSLPDYHLTCDKAYGVVLLLYHLGRLMIALFFHDPTKARESRKAGREWLHGGQGLVYPIFFQLFEAVTLYDEYNMLTAEELEHIATTTSSFDALEKAHRGNFSTPKLWLQAEEARAKGTKTEALIAYDKAIAAATDAGYVHYAACMNERAAQLLDNSKLGVGYLVEARQQWQDWGCIPKVAMLDHAFPRLFAASSAYPAPPAAGAAAHTVGRHSALTAEESLQVSSMDVDWFSPHRGGDPHTAAVPSWKGGESGAHKHSLSDSHDGRSPEVNDEGRAELRTSLSTHSETHSRSHLGTELDLRTVVMASNVISEEITIDGAVSKLLSLVLRTAGAEMGLLLLIKAGVLCPEALVKSDGSGVQHLRRKDSVDLHPEKYPCSVINFVARTRSMVVNELDAVGEVISDPYLTMHKPKSILCLALVSQVRVIGVLYMENSQTTNAFTPDRLEILSLISAHAAATIEKARLVQDLKSANEELKISQADLESHNRNLEVIVDNRTTELRHKNDLLLAEVTEKERAQAEMRSAKEVAEAATAMKSQFLANMSHEIRTPFNAVVALAGLLLDTQLNPLQTDYVETIKNSSQELLVVINDILDYSKIELDHLSMSKDRIQIRTVLESSMDMLAERAASKGIEMALVLEQGDIQIIGDLTRLRQIVVNLLSNAVKFTSVGEIIVTAWSERVDSSEDEGPQVRVRVAVKDSGIGIAPENFGKLFKVYSQVDGSETTKMFGGTGLGLAISRKLSLLMGGDILVESELGHGATFTLDFVAPPIQDSQPDAYSAAQNPDLVGKRCLVVDSNETSRHVLRQLVTSFGLAVDAPDDISDAYGMAMAAQVAGNPHDVILVDAFLPGFAALTLLRRLRQRNLTAPACALTRMGNPIYEELRQLDCRFLIKPIKRNRLHHTLRDMFPTHEAHRASPPVRSISDAFPTSLAGRNPLTILCAEDNPINVKVVSHLLKRLGYTTDVAEDGQVAYERVLKKKYDLIFMDVNMPRMNGLESTRLICEAIPDKETRPLIVAMTALAMTSDKDMCLAAGCDGYLSKPILVPDLVAALNDAGAKVQRQRARDTPIPAPVTVNSSELVPFEV